MHRPSIICASMRAIMQIQTPRSAIVFVVALIPSSRNACPQGGNPAGAGVMLSHCILPRCVLPCHGCLRLQMRQIRHGSMGGYGCSAFRCLIVHIIRGKVPKCPCMTDWGRANLVQCSGLHRSDRSPPTGQTSLIKGRAKLLFLGSNTASRRRRRSRSLLLIRRSLKPMQLFRSVRSRCP